jgi:hypothetical protein
MKTDHLIDLLAADNAAPRPNLRLRLLGAALGGSALSFLLLVVDYGIRPNLAEAVLNWRVATKFAVALTLAATGAVLTLRLARPMPERGSWLILLPAPLILAIAGIAEMAVNPPGAWPSLAIGRYGTACLVAVPLLSALPLLGVLWALQSGAPAFPAQAGVAAGAMAAGLGSALYAMHCPDDSPLFLALFYGMGTAAIILAGRAGGARMLHW